MLDDTVKLRHMLDAANEACSFVKDRQRKDLDDVHMLALSLVRLIEIIGEAAARVSPDMKNRCPTIPGTDIVGMRNRLIHAYFDIDLDRVWDTIADDLPPLITEL